MNLIEKLNKIDIKDLQKLDYAKLLQDAKKRPDILVSVSLFLITAYFSFSHFIKYQSQVRAVKNTITELQQKNSVIEKYNSTKNKYDEFISSLPNPLSETDLIDILTDNAAAHKIQIETMSPSVTEEQELVKIVSVSLKIVAPSYQNLWLFIYSIEKSPINLRIDSWSGTMSNNTRFDPNQNAAQTAKMDEIHSNLDISLINYKNE